MPDGGMPLPIFPRIWDVIPDCGGSMLTVHLAIPLRGSMKREQVACVETASDDHHIAQSAAEVRFGRTGFRVVCTITATWTWWPDSQRPRSPRPWCRSYRLHRRCRRGRIRLIERQNLRRFRPRTRHSGPAIRLGKASLHSSLPRNPQANIVQFNAENDGKRTNMLYKYFDFWEDEYAGAVYRSVRKCR